MKSRLTTLLICTLCIVSACSDDSSKTNNNNNNNTNNTRSDMSSTSDMSRNDMSSNADMPGGSSDMNPGSADANADMPPIIRDMGPFEVNDMGQVLCGDRACQCSDGIDNDGNGLIDGFDPECTGPFDDDESSFATGIPGDNRDPNWQDCFFDGNSGSGDDKCRYHTDCLTGKLPPTDSKCTLSDQCLQFCKPRVPNGCDCFGCCEIFKDDGSSVNVVIGGSCTFEKIDDPNACTQCVLNTQCVNTCGECELCLGKTIDELPESCNPNTQQPGDMGTSMGDMGTPTGDMGTTNPGPINSCDDGRMACDATHRCAFTEYCLQGCCIPVPL